MCSSPRAASVVSRSIQAVTFSACRRLARADGVNAQLSNGVLTVTIPKSEEAKPRQIEIKG
jgi:HSP20 family molecular chaperone IbpA